MLAIWSGYEGKLSDHPGHCVPSSPPPPKRWLQQKSGVIGTELCPLHQTGTDSAGKVSHCLSLQEGCIFPS